MLAMLILCWLFYSRNCEISNCIWFIYSIKRLVYTLRSRFMFLCF